MNEKATDEKVVHLNAQAAGLNSGHDGTGSYSSLVEHRSIRGLEVWCVWLDTPLCSIRGDQ